MSVVLSHSVSPNVSARLEYHRGTTTMNLNALAMEPEEGAEWPAYCGLHPGALQCLRGGKRLATFCAYVSSVVRQSTGPEVRLGIICRSGVVRSVATAELAAQHLREARHAVGVFHHSRQWWPAPCANGTCTVCPSPDGFLA
jgi:hypothetical protein